MSVRRVAMVASLVALFSVLAGLRPAGIVALPVQDPDDAMVSLEADLATDDAGTSAALTASEEWFGTLAPGSSLPSGDDCAGRVRRTGWEPRPENADANSTAGFSGVRIDGASGAFNARYAWRIDGNFTGTTDEIIQWAACKWGFDEDTVRAQAVQESYWRQDGLGD